MFIITNDLQAPKKKELNQINHLKRLDFFLFHNSMLEYLLLAILIYWEK